MLVQGAKQYFIIIFFAAQNLTGKSKMTYRILCAVPFPVREEGGSIVINTKFLCKASGDRDCILVVV